MRSWDRFMVPMPFSRVVVSWARAVGAPRADADAAMLEAKRVELNDALERARGRAEAYFAAADSAGPVSEELNSQGRGLK
jgi:hypothetical protein